MYFRREGGTDICHEFNLSRLTERVQKYHNLTHLGRERNSLFLGMLHGLNFIRLNEIMQSVSKHDTLMQGEQIHGEHTGYAMCTVVTFFATAKQLILPCLLHKTTWASIH